MTETDMLLSALRGQLDDDLDLNHHMEVVEWFQDRADHLPGLVMDALDVYAMALEQAETTRFHLHRIIRAAELQQVAEQLGRPPA